MENIDFLSPSITLFYLGKKTHTSKIGGLLIMIMGILMFVYISHILIEEFSFGKVNSIFYKKYENEAGYYSFNTSSLFNFIQISKKGISDKYNHKNIRIYSYSMPLLNNENESALESFDHWVFDSCEINENNTNIDFSNIKNFNNGACIKYFYNSTEKQYISNGNPNFKWPSLEHGVSNNNNIFVNTIVTKCSNNSISVKILGYCNSEDEINEYLKDHQGIYLYFVDNLIDVTNYRKPLQSYFYPINSNIGIGLTYADNYIHFSPVRLTTSEGLILNTKKYYNAINFDQNRKGEGKNLDNSSIILVKYHHLLQNNVHIYERRYNNLFDIFSQIGGVVQMIFYMFYGINYLYNSYIVLYDTNHIFFNIEKGGSKININRKDLKTILFDDENGNNYNSFNYIKPVIDNRAILSKNNVNKKALSLNKISVKPIRNVESCHKDDLLSGHLNLKKKNNVDIRISSENKDYLDDSKKNVDLNDNFLVNIFKKVKKKSCYSDQFKMINFFNPSKKESENKNINNFVDKDNNNHLLQDNNMHLIKDEIMSQTMIIGKKKFSFFVCMKMICNKGIKNNMTVLMNFRKKLLSEEHLFKSHLSSILFEKHNKINSRQNISFVNFYNEL